MGKAMVWFIARQVIMSGGIANDYPCNAAMQRIDSG
jgi:hypothetical protein